MTEKIIKISEEFEEIINSVDNKKAMIFFDDDADGICSGVLLKKFLERKGFSISKCLSETKKTPLFSEKFNNIISNEEIKLLVITDFNIAGYNKLKEYKAFKKNNQNVKIIIIDHHIDDTDYIELDNVSTKRISYINSQGLIENMSSSEYCCSKLVYDILLNLDKGIETFDWISAIGIIGDSVALKWKPFFKEIISKENKRIIDAGEEDLKDEIILPNEFEDFFLTPYGKASNYIMYGTAKSEEEPAEIFKKVENSTNIYVLINKLIEYDSIKKEIYDHVENYDYFIKNSNLFPEGKTTKGDFSIFEVDIKSNCSIGRMVANTISYKDQEKIFFVYQKREDGFVYISVRGGKGKIHLGDIMNSCAKKIEGANGGGHPVASGARCPKDKFKEFREYFYENLENE